MSDRKKDNPKYEPPRVVDLGSVSISQGQQVSPAGYCSTGTSPAGFGSECDQGESVSICWAGLSYLGLWDTCNPGSNAANVCRQGSGVG